MSIYQSIGGRGIDFLAKDNACGQSLLQLVSRGNAIIAELLRLADFVPSVFSNPQSLHAELLIDFSYFKISDAFEAKLEANLQLLEADEELRDNYLETILTRFFHAFESVHVYVSDLNRFIEDLEDGVFIQQSLESVFLNTDGKQLLAESLYLYGVMLLVIDNKLDGVVRERLLVAYYRYSAQRSSLHSDLDDVCTLLRGTGLVKGGKRPPNYPESFFGRVPLNKNFVSMVIGRLRSDDLYNQIAAFPLPEHRSSALAGQAAMLYVCLYFSPGILHQQTSTMREIVDKYFPDNWMISVYMGMVVNLSEAWEPYRAARSALATCLDWENVRATGNKHGQELDKLNKGLEQFLSEGTLTKEFILDNTNKLLNALRRCNVTLRWLMLHTTPLRQEWENSKRSKQLRELVIAESKFKVPALFNLLLSTSQFELKLQEKLKEMLTEKQAKCASLQRDIADRLSELVEVFSGSKPLVRVEKNEKLQAWFADLKKQIEQLDCETSPNVTGRKLVQLIRALEEVQEFHSLDAHLGVSQFLQEIRNLMHQLLRLLNIKEETLVQIQLIADLSYAWEIIDKYTSHMQEGIKQEPALAIKLRATFLKLSSALGLPLLRIQEAESPDYVSVSQFYSRELVLYVRRVLQVIPETLFSLLARIVSLQTSRIQELPTKLDKDKMRDLARLDDRYEVARLTHAISVLTEGVLMMKTTLVGIIKVDPKQLLEDGVRKELVRQVATALHQTLAFNPKAKQSELVPRLRSLAAQMDGTRRSFVYISDYISLCGLKIWQEEFSRIVNYNLEQECNSFLKHQIQDYESVYQSKVIPIPTFPPADGVSNNFFGRLAREILKETDPKSAVYIHNLSTWYDPKTHMDKLNPQFFKLLISAVGNIGVSGLDRLCCFMIVSLLEQFIKDFNRKLLDTRDMNEFLQQTLAAFTPHTRLFEQPTKAYSAVMQKPAKILPSFVDLIAKTGQLQILRMQFLREVANAAKFESKLLEEALQTLNGSVLADVEAHVKDPSKPYPKDDNPLMYELASYLEASGISDPLKKIYISQRTKLAYFPLFSFLIVLSQIPKLSYVKNVGLLSKKPGEAADGVPFVIGLATLLQQFHPSEKLAFLQHIAQYVNSFLRGAVRSGTKRFEVAELVPEMAVMLKFLAECCRFGAISDQDAQSVIPESLLQEYHACLNPS